MCYFLTGGNPKYKVKTTKAGTLMERKNKMKLIVYMLVLLSLTGGIVLTYVDSNTELSLQSLSDTEMLETQGAGPCEIIAFCFNVGVGNWCGSTPCRTSWKHLTSKKQEAVAYLCCIPTAWFKIDCVVNGDELQKCAEVFDYFFPLCVGPSIIVPHPISDRKEQPGCDQNPGPNTRIIMVGTTS